MKANFSVAKLGVLSTVLFLACLAPVARAENCSTATVAGAWGFTLSGSATLPTGPVQVAAVGRVVLDHEGNGAGTEARSVGGGYADETLAVSWTVNPDCTGTLNANIYEDGQLVRVSVTTIVFDGNSKEFRMIQKSLALPDGTQLPVVITLEGKKQ